MFAALYALCISFVLLANTCTLYVLYISGFRVQVWGSAICTVVIDCHHGPPKMSNNRIQQLVTGTKDTKVQRHLQMVHSSSLRQ